MYRTFTKESSSRNLYATLILSFKYLHTFNRFQAPNPMDSVSAEPIVMSVSMSAERDGQGLDPQADRRNRNPYFLLHPAGQDSYGAAQ